MARLESLWSQYYFHLFGPVTLLANMLVVRLSCWRLAKAWAVGFAGHGCHG